MAATVPSTTTSKGSPGVALTSIFASPTRAFQEVARGATWIVPWIVVSVMMIISSLLMRPLTIAAMNERMANLSEEQRQAAMNGPMMKVGMIINSAFMPVMLLVFLLVSALIFRLILNSSGAKLEFKPALRAMAYSSIISVGLSMLFGAILLAVKARSTEITGYTDMPRLGLDLIGGEGFVRGILSAFNIFSIWWLVVLVFGFAVLTGRKPKQVAPAVIGAGIVWLILMGCLAGASMRG